MITAADLQAIGGSRSRSANLVKIADAFNKYAAQYGVTHQQDIADILAHISVETGGFRSLSENLNYSVQRLLVTFGRHRISEAKARQFGRTSNRKADQVSIANEVYGGAYGKKNLGNIMLGDGWAYRGSGPGQVTGRANFKRAEKLTGIAFVNNPDLMRSADEGMKATLALWKHWNMNKYQGGSVASRKKWNGGTHGLAEYQAAYARAMKRKLSVDVAAVPIPKPKPSLPPEKVEEALREDGSRTITQADKAEKGLLAKLMSLITAGGASVLSALQGMDWRVVAIIAITGALAYLYYDWKTSKAIKAIKVARVDDAITGAHTGRADCLECL